MAENVRYGPVTAFRWGDTWIIKPEDSATAEVLAEMAAADEPGHAAT